EAVGSGTRLTLWHAIDRRFISWGAAGWHIAFDVLDRLLSGDPIGRVVGADAMKFAGWKQLVAEYAKQFDVDAPAQHHNSVQDSCTGNQVFLAHSAGKAAASRVSRWSYIIAATI